jgi:hypothetical protein
MRKGTAQMPDYPLPKAFVHTATRHNTSSNWTDIENELTNNDPKALVSVTQNWNPGGVDGTDDNYNPHPIGVWYNKEKGKWSIFNEDKATMPIGVAFNVWVYQDIPSKSVNKTSNTTATPMNTTPDLTKARTSRSRLFKILFFVVLPLLMLWLLGDVILYFQENIGMTHLQKMFMLRDNPFVSLVLLLLGFILILMFIDDHWGKMFAWLGTLDPLNHPLQAAILLSTTFFVILFVMAMVFPLTGYSFKSDWSLLLVATIPLLALLALILINKYQSLRLEGAGFKFEFSGAIMAPEADPTQELHITLEEKSIEFTLAQMKAGAMTSEARSLVVRIEAQMSLEFSMLQKHVREISTMVPIRYIIFINGDSHYLGFIPLENFMTALPVGSLQQVTEGTLKLLGVYRLALTKPTGQPIEKQALLEEYRQMVLYNLPGIPVLDEHSEFKSMLERDSIEQAVVMQLLEKSAKIV